jgi:hypothetical protein
MLAFLMAAAVAGAPDWSALSSTEGWSAVGTRSSDFGPVVVTHKVIGGIDCLTGVVTVDVPPEKLLAVVEDVPAATKWSSASLRVSEVLGSADGATRFWQQIDVPNWTLVADRYWVLEGRSAPVDSGVRYRWQRVPASTFPAVVSRAEANEAGSIEPPTNWGEWVFRRATSGTEVHYRACADVGGSLPESVQRWVATRTLPDTVSDLVKEARRRG